MNNNEQLRECINSGQVSAAQVVAHAEAGELPPLPEPNLLAPGTYPHGVLAYTWDQMQDYAIAALAAERAEVVRLREALEGTYVLAIGHATTYQLNHQLAEVHPTHQAILDKARAALTAPGENHG